MRDIYKFKELDNAVKLVVNTKSPQKWLLIDRETGQAYQGSDKGFWDRLDPVIKQEDVV